jgi:ABC-type dipeptide/oligopeptide/nickel transport system permease subunit
MSATEPVDELSAKEYEQHHALEEEEAIQGRPFELTAARGGLLGKFANDKLAFVAIAWLVIIVLVAILAPWIAPYGQSEGTLGDADKSPSGTAARGITSWAPPRRATTSSADCSTAHARRCSSAALVVLAAGAFGVLIGLIAGTRAARSTAGSWAGSTSRSRSPGCCSRCCSSRSSAAASPPSR